jgi:hypothetical protein
MLLMLVLEIPFYVGAARAPVQVLCCAQEVA